MSCQSALKLGAGKGSSVLLEQGGVQGGLKIVLGKTSAAQKFSKGKHDSGVWTLVQSKHQLTFQQLPAADE